MTSRTPRQALYGQIHAAKKFLALDDECYRSILFRLCGERSVKEIPLNGLDKVLAEFRRLGWKGKKFQPSHRPEIRKIFALWKDMGPLLRKAGSKDSLRSFCKRMTGVDDPNFLNGEQARHFTEILKQYKIRLEKAIL